MATAIRIRGLAKRFAPAMEIDGAEHPREAWRVLLHIAGLAAPIDERDDVRATVAAQAPALRDVSLDIETESVVCLAGPSGAGKSVLLQILGGKIPPTSGTVEIYGDVTSVLAVGDNVDERMTADENIRQAAQGRRLSPEETARYTQEVIGFAELSGFEHAPLRTFSTGMLLRLSAALALCGSPSIVLIDDVLKVGDIAFQQRCADRVRALKDARCTLVLAFGDDGLVRQVATRVVTLAAGAVVSDAPVTFGMAALHDSRAAEVEWRVLLTDPAESDVMVLRSVDLAAGQEGDGTYVDLSLRLFAKRGGLRCRPSIFLMRQKTVLYRSLYSEFLDLPEAGGFVTTVRIPTNVLQDGSYAITISIATVADGITYSIKADQAVTLTVQRDREEPASPSSDPLLVLTVPWEIERVPVEAA